MAFNQNEYINDYKKNHYKQWKADLPTEEKDLYDKVLKENNMSKTEFLRTAFEKIFNVKIKK